MRIHVGRIIVAALAGCFITVAAEAQSGSPIVDIPEPSRFSVTGTIGRAGGYFGAENESSPALASAVEVAVSPRWLVRMQFGRARFDVKAHRGAGPVPFPADRATIRRITASAVRLYDRLPFRLRTYLIGGVGAYEPRFAVWPRNEGARLGFHGGGGFERPIGYGRVAIRSELQMEILNGWAGSPISDSKVLALTLSGGLKIGF